LTTEYGGMSMRLIVYEARVIAYFLAASKSNHRCLYLQRVITLSWQH
jgi:hypothetical protein